MVGLEMWIIPLILKTSSTATNTVPYFKSRQDIWCKGLSTEDYSTAEKIKISRFFWY
jgi:hypothetical protein